MIERRQTRRPDPVSDAEFQTFWANYPRKCGRLAAVKAYRKARTLATAAEILTGVESYKARKPNYADYCHPTTWLNQGRWMDETDTPVRAPSSHDWQCPHEPACTGRWACHTKTQIASMKGSRG